MQEGNRTRLLAAAAVALLIAGVCAVAYTSRGDAARSRDELLSPLQVGRYAVRAERQSGDYDSKAERQIAFATDNDNAATAERQLAAKEESRARDSAYLAADIKSRIDKILEAGRDQVRRGGLVVFPLTLGSCYPARLADGCWRKGRLGGYTGRCPGVPHARAQPGGGFPPSLFGRRWRLFRL
jgi:hypothetical protein